MKNELNQTLPVSMDICNNELLRGILKHFQPKSFGLNRVLKVSGKSTINHKLYKNKNLCINLDAALIRIIGWHFFDWWVISKYVRNSIRINPLNIHLWTSIESIQIRFYGIHKRLIYIACGIVLSGKLRHWLRCYAIIAKREIHYIVGEYECWYRTVYRDRYSIENILKNTYKHRYMRIDYTWAATVSDQCNNVRL